MSQKEIKYFKTKDEAQKVADLIPQKMCVNQYQWPGESQAPEIREFFKGFAVQMGDCGPYVTKLFFKNLTKIPHGLEEQPK